MTIDITKFSQKNGYTRLYFYRRKFQNSKATEKALEYIDIYKDDARINGLTLDVNLEEKTVELFAENIILAGKVFIPAHGKTIHTLLAKN